MTDSLFSDHWYRVSDLKPGLKNHVEVAAHQYRGERWWLLIDKVTGRQHRLDEVARFLVALMDGDRSLQSIWDESMAKLDDRAPSQSDVIELLGRLHAADLLRTDLDTDCAELFRRARGRRASKSRRKFLNPLYLRLPMIDPDRVLGLLSPVGRAVFSRPMFVIWTLVILSAVGLTYLHWGELSGSLHRGLLEPANLVVLLVVFLVMKFFHELSHGLAVKAWGGEVRDMGVVLLVFLPIPYVDASAANAFSEKRRRIVTSAAGIMLELFFAALALIAWVVVEPGFVRQVALNVVLVGAVSSLLFNGNPLLRFDGYYVLADALEIPNLAGRSQSFLRYVIRRVLFGVQAERLVQSRCESAWLAGYGLASACYRVALLLTIAVYLADSFFIVGVLLGIWAIGSQLLWPLVKGVMHMFDASHSYLRRARVYCLSAGAFGAVYAVLFVVPIPSTSAADGIVWLPDESIIRAETDCFVRAVVVPTGTLVNAGSRLVECENPDLLAERDVLEARIGALRMKYRSHGLREQLERRLLSDEIAVLDAQLRRIRERIDGLTVVSQADGTFVVADPGLLQDRFYEKGQNLGFVLSDSHLTVKAAVRQQDIDLVSRHRSVEVRFAGLPGESHKAFLFRQVPAATRYLPSAALGSSGGGKLAVDPEDVEGRLLQEDVYLIDLILQSSDIPRLVGLRAYVLFEDGETVIGEIAHRKLQLLFMRHLSV